MGWLAAGGRGTRVGDRYRLIERLGTGGMSVVWRGHDEILGRPVAVKVLARPLADDFRFRSRLRQEAHAAARLNHPHVTSVFDFGFDEDLTLPYVVMELNDGEPVSARLRREGPFPWRAAVTIAAQVASALATAHDQGIVHRDVTPANIMLTGAGAKVVDFGISALTGQRDAAADGSLLGTPAYLAPERLGGGPVAPPADVYALGVLLHRCLTGRLPWPAGTTTEALRAHLYEQPEPVPSLPGLPPSVGELCLRCLAKNPADRPTAAELAESLASLVGVLCPPAPSGVPRPSFVRRLSAAIVARRQRLHAAVVTLVLLATLGLVWTSTQEPDEVGTAQAAAAGPGPQSVVPHGTGCRVRFRVQRDTGTDFGVQLTVINTGEHALSGWRLEFAFTGGQRLTDVSKRLSQRGRTVVLRPRKGRNLRPGRSATVTLTGSYRATNPLPLTFTLNGHPCQAEVVGAVADPAPRPMPSPAATTTPATRKKTRTAPTPSRAATSSPAPPPRGRGGFSIAI
ncbi:serine/threonine-protein kinase [Actinoplanes sp. N902-109]|uniref:serine/threonine-protein kinase n=1 Tax=Actinoplanes sp. (strain N902-109) TaxID=649831 RepID=UPI00032948F7|nr:serine/threonine-protein kinase [Actinoplanes sp. N902-109]AGL14357.1 serine/threonine protein kinase [Actinoplanes sp. N902-109]